ncbi:MAG: hypothetical protein WDO74_13500 [Pseudomonadota bacterium]
MLRRSLMALALFFLLTGCGGGPLWRVVSQANPNPLLGQKQFAVAPLDFSAVTVGAKTEADYLASKTDEKDKAAWAEAKVALQEEFNKGIRVAGNQAGLQLILGESGAPFIIKAKVDFIEPGYYAYVSSKASQVKMTVKIVSADGKEIDELLVEHYTSGSMGDASVASRLRSDGEALGTNTAQYLSQRVSPKAP